MRTEPYLKRPATKARTSAAAKVKMQDVLASYFTPAELVTVHMSQKDLELRGRKLFSHKGLVDPWLKSAAQAYARTLHMVMEQNGWQEVNQEYHDRIERHVLLSVQPCRKSKPQIAR